VATLSVNAFDRSDADQAGLFWQSDARFAAGSWDWNTIMNLPDIHAVLAWMRVDNEDVLDTATFDPAHRARMVERSAKIRPASRKKSS
jgi:hypothetical protein